MMNRPRLPKTLEVLQNLRVDTTGSDAVIHPMLTTAYNECMLYDSITVFERVLLHIGDVSRQHNILSELGILSDKGGAQQRKTFRSVLRWWASHMPASFKKNIRVFVEFTLYENIMFYEIKTDRYKGTLISKESFLPFKNEVWAFLKERINGGKDHGLIAKHLPKYVTGNYRTTIKRIGTSYKWRIPSNKEWVKVNDVFVKKDGEYINGEYVQLNSGDIIKYQRNKVEATLTKQKEINAWIHGFCGVMGWSIADYKEFRSKQNTPEQKFSTKSILSLPKSDFWKFLDGLTSGQRYRVARMLIHDSISNKWGDLPKWYNEWEESQSKIAQELRDAFNDGDEKKRSQLQKQLKVKATGKTTFDLLSDMLDGKLTSEQVDNTYQAMIEKMDLVANVFPIVDGSGSMNSVIHGTNISRRAIAYALAITFSTRNPVEEFRGTLGWFSRDFKIIGESKYVNNRPNRFVSGSEFNKSLDTAERILCPTKTFSQNYDNLYRHDPQDVNSTNMGAAIEYFIEFAKKEGMSPELLPNALIFITDNENNTGTRPSVALAKANEFGWNPLCIFWGITNVPPYMLNEYKNIPNVLLVGGFNEGVLSQILRGIKSGSVDPEDELWIINDDPRYSVIS